MRHAASPRPIDDITLMTQVRRFAQWSQSIAPALALRALRASNAHTAHCLLLVFEPRENRESVRASDVTPLRSPVQAQAIYAGSTSAPSSARPWGDRSLRRTGNNHIAAAVTSTRPCGPAAVPCLSISRCMLHELCLLVYLGLGARSSDGSHLLAPLRACAGRARPVPA